MFDHLSHDMLTGNDDFQSAQEQLANGQVIQHTNFGYEWQHSTNGIVDGHSHLAGNQVVHQDALHQTTGYSKLFGANTVAHEDQFHNITGYDIHNPDGSVTHQDAFHQITGRTDAFGNSFNANNTYASKFTAIFKG